TFSQMTPELAALAPGHVMVGDVSQNAPDGFLREVTAVSTTGGQVVVTTGPATLEDAIQQGELHLSRALSPEEVVGFRVSPGVRAVNLLPGEFYIELEDAVLYDADGNPGTTGDQIRADGSITLEPGYDFDLMVQDWQLQQLAFTSWVEETAELEITAYVAAAGIEREVPLANYVFTPITIFIGPLPVVIIPELVIVAGIDGEVHVGLTTAVTQQATLTAGVEYDDGDWGTISDFDNSFTYSPPAVTAGLEVKGYAGTRLALKLYGVVGPYIRIHFYLELEVDLFANPWWILYGGLEAPVGILVEILGHQLADYEALAIGYRIILAQSDPADGMTSRVSVASDGTQGNEDSYSPSISADGRYVAFSSTATNLVSGDTNGMWDVFVHDRQTGQTTRVSVASDGTQGNDESTGRSISADGRYVAFESHANNLVSGDTNGSGDVFVHDRETGQTTRVSVASDGTQGNDHSDWPSISANGRFVAFHSIANNLVSGDTNDFADVFVHDRETGQTTRVSVASGGTQGDGHSSWPSISADGRYVTFESFANNLVSGDNNGNWDVFVHDRQTGQTTCVSIASDGTQGNNGSYFSSISADGRYVAFDSDANNLVSGDTNGTLDAFVHDRQTGQTTRVSIASDGTQGNDNSSLSSISADGRYVTFSSGADNLVIGDTNGVWDAFVHDRQTGQTTRVSIASDGTQGNADSFWSFISADGRYVAFESFANNLVGGDTNDVFDVFVHDRGVQNRGSRGVRR
ncbi:MAG: hypothetical protein L0332_25425, partial [Chloroflexi bacterium]|nr:hypothetical protein [Chloroflexota bacterium]